jgi:hypothetical protein
MSKVLKQILQKRKIQELKNHSLITLILYIGSIEQVILIL